jgi:predicted nucleic acid-binding protein
MVGMVGDLFPFEVRPENAFDFAAGAACEGRAQTTGPTPEKPAIILVATLPSKPHPMNPSHAPLSELPLTFEAPRIVLDTNVALDWLLFGDPTVAALALAVCSGRVSWVATVSMREELAHVLGRGLAAAWRADGAAILAAWDARATLRPEPPGQRFRVSDPDDQKFIDLAIDAQARWLVSRDRAVLKLARKAATAGLAIVTPRALALETPPG